MLIQLYHSGDDYISTYADKTIDVQLGSAVVNLSLGATTRAMVLCDQRKIKWKRVLHDQAQNLICRMGPCLSWVGMPIVP